MLIRMVRALGTGIFVMPNDEEFTVNSNVFVDRVQRNEVIISKNAVDVPDVKENTVVEVEL